MRYQRIQPTWKSGGPVDYSLNAQQSIAGPIPLFHVASSGGTAIGSGETVASMAKALEIHGMRSDDLDEQSKLALREMLSWRLPSMEFSGTVTALFVFSFDATPSCKDMTNCPLPGPTNELLAATVERFCEQSKVPIEVYAQWEISSALLASKRMPPERIHAAGDAGVYMNTQQIMQMMLDDMAQQTPQPSVVAVVAHPDHLRRAFRTLQAQYPLVTVLPAMMPYGLDWPKDQREGSALNLYGADYGYGLVHSRGQHVESRWYEQPFGYFPDGDPQIWVRDREVWILYDHWAMAKGVADGIIQPSQLELELVPLKNQGMSMAYVWLVIGSCLVTLMLVYIVRRWG